MPEEGRWGNVHFMLTTRINNKMLIHRGLCKAINEGAYNLW